MRFALQRHFLERSSEDRIVLPDSGGCIANCFNEVLKVE
jgi:hypothetical protein